MKVFKQIYEKIDYEFEKNIYLRLKENRELTEKFLFLKDFSFDDDYNILILNKAECDLLDLMKILS